MINEGGTGAELWLLSFMPRQEPSLGHTGLDVLHAGCGPGTVIGPGQGHKDGCEGTVTLQVLGGKLREGHCPIEVQIRSCVSAEGEVMGSYQEHWGRAYRGEALGEVLRKRRRM